MTNLNTLASRVEDASAEAIVVHRWAIIGPYGNIWTPTLFDKPEQAEDHLRGFWGRQGFDGYFAAPVEVTICDLTSAEMPRVKLVHASLRARSAMEKK